MHKKKERQILLEVEITDWAAEGNSVCKPEGKAIFVKNAVPGDVVDLEIFKSKKSFAEAKAIHWHKYSDLREKPRCIHFGICGGCTRQDLQYQHQLRFKSKEIFDHFQRIGKFEFPELLPALGADQIFNYRNKTEFTFSASRWMTPDEMIKGAEIKNPNALGFHIPGRFDKVLDIEECHLQGDLQNQIRLAVKNFAIENDYSFFNLKSQSGFLRNLMLRNNLKGEWMVVPVFFYEDVEKREALLEMLANKYPQISSLMYVINEKKNDSIADQEVVLYKGSDFLTEQMGELQFIISPKSFFQTNTLQGIKLYECVKKLANLDGTEMLYDLYTGTGTIACFLASSAKKVIGIEYVEAAVADARKNSELNKIQNTEFFSGDMKDVLVDSFFEEHGKPDVIITDPPRAGMHQSVIDAILNAEPEKIVYVSCNPATQARDIALMDEKYKVIAVQPVDMFPHTRHIENIALLIKR